MESFEFRGNERFEVRRRLGAGAFGVVYEALDRERNAVVALKALHKAEPDALYRFKKEFRGLAGLAHPNLVALYELFSDADRWFFTMELVVGVDLLEWVRPEPDAPFDGAIERRLRPAILQVASGLHAIHEAGKLHCDIKPANVLVSSSGQVKLLDFGMLVELGRPGLARGSPVAGTPAFVAPEHAVGEPPSEAGDWYGLGAMLYQSLTGQLPFSGEPLEVMVSKQWFEPPSPRSLAPRVPEDLDVLCRELLNRDPALRPSGREVLRRLRGEPERRATRRLAPRTPARRGVFVGRRVERRALDEALEASAAHPVTLLVEGRSGIGKSALLKHFLEDVAATPRTLVLAGRCYQQEAVPYKAVDSLVDELSDQLGEMSETEVEELLPRDVLALARLFPVLEKVSAVREASASSLAVRDPIELRRRAFSAFRALLQRLSKGRRVVLAVDDLHWGDVDSALLFERLLAPPGAPPLLLVAAFRTEEKATNPVLLALRAALATAADVREVVLSELPPAEALALAEALAAGLGASKELVAGAARESGGNPFLLDEIVRFGDAATVSLEEVHRRRVDALPEEARALLEVIAVAGRPVPTTVASAAARITSDEQALVTLLRGQHLVWSRQRGEREELDTYHNRIREAVVARLPKDVLRERHWRLANALEGDPDADPEPLSFHFLVAGDRIRAGSYAAAAADRAAAALAFDRSCRLYREAIELLGDDSRRRRELTGKLAAALSNAGRGREAAEAYARAADGAPEDEALDLKRRAAEQLLRSGHIDAGLSALAEVLRSEGLALAPTPRGAVTSLLLRRLKLALRGFRFTERPASEVPAGTLRRIDVCWAVAVGLGIVDTVRGAEFQARHLELALDAGEPYRIARALSLEVGYSAAGGLRSARATARRLRLATNVAGRLTDPHARGLVTLVSGVASALEGRFRDACDLTQSAETILRDQCSGVAWELFNAQYFGLLSLAYLGEYDVIAERLPGLLAEAEERGDLYAATSLTTRIAYVSRLAEDRPDEAREELRRAMDRWSRHGFHLQHLWALFAETEIDLYEGEGRRAWERLEREWATVERSLLTRIQILRIGIRQRHARAALAAAAAVPRSEAEPLLAVVRRDARRIDQEGAAWGDPFAALLLAGAAATAGRADEALRRLGQAELGFEAAQLAAHAAAARWRRGERLGGEEGRRLLESAGEWLAGKGVVDPRRLVAALAPGFV